VLAGVAVMLGSQSRSLLLGAAASPETREKLHDIVHSFPEVVDMPRMLSMQLGANSVLVTGELCVKRGMSTDEIEALIVRIDDKIGAELPEISDTFWELRSVNGEPAKESAPKS
jgi:divalent metal cation (Fe/Co/Zn/Cd) transporter